MRHEPVAVRHEVDYLIGEKVGFDGGYPEPCNTFHFFEFLYQFEEGLLPDATGILSEITKVHTGENDFLHAFFREFAGIRQHPIDAVAPAFSAGHGDGAE